MHENEANISFEDSLWRAVDTLRGQVDVAEFKHVVLGLVFLKSISDTFQERYTVLQHDPAANPEDREEYLTVGIFWVPEQARWSFLQAHTKSSKICNLIDEALEQIEKENVALKGVLPKGYASSAINTQCIGKLIDLIGTIDLDDEEKASTGTLDRVYEYFLGRFADAEGKGGGEFYTPRSVVKLLVEMLEPYRGSVYDPCCGSGGMFVQSVKFVQAHGGPISDISIYGQETNATTWQLCKMNLAIRGIEANLGPHPADTFHQDLHKDLKADFILANPPFNVSNWGGERLRHDVRWKYGIPPTGSANFAWMQHFLHHLAPNGIAGFVMANGSMSSSTSSEREIRRAIIEADFVDCMVALPTQLFYTTQIPACLWFLSHNKVNSKFRARRGQTLFIDARKLGYMANRIHRELSEAEIVRIAHTYHAWRGESEAGVYEDVLGFCRSVPEKEIAAQEYVLTPVRYVGAAEVEEEEEPFEERMVRLITKLEEYFEEAARLEAAIRANFKGVRYGD